MFRKNGVQSWFPPKFERLSKSIVGLPIYHTLKEEEVDYVIRSVNTTFNDLDEMIPQTELFNIYLMAFLIRSVELTISENYYKEFVRCLFI